MKIAIIGSGAVGCYYGARLVQRGHEVHFLMRRDLEAVRRGGLRIESVHGSFHLERVNAHGDSREIGPVDLVVLDPPRSGAGAAVVRSVVAARPRAVAYVACDPAALARDVATFRQEGWRLAELRGYDCFPMTHHVECVALLVSG